MVQYNIPFLPLRSVYTERDRDRVQRDHERERDLLAV